MRRRKLELPEGDRAYLETLGLPWETVAEGRAQWLIIHDWPIPSRGLRESRSQMLSVMWPVSTSL